MENGYEADRPSSAAAAAYKKLVRKVVTGELQPGAVLQERELAEQLGLGRTPVREAVQRLAYENILTIFPRRGIAVAKLGLTDVQDIFEARETIESKLAALAAIRRDADEADEIQRLGERAAEDAESDAVSTFLSHDQLLHQAIGRAARNRMLSGPANHLLLLSTWLWHQYFSKRGSQRSDYFDHSGIVEAILARDADRAGEAMAAHVRESHRLVRRAL